MSVQLKKQITEVHSVMDTLVETTDHLITLTKVEELKQSLHIFSSLIEGIEAVFKVIPKFDINVLEQMKTIEQTLPEMAKAFENEALPIVEELTTTSLQPALMTMKDCYGKTLEDMN